MNVKTESQHMGEFLVSEGPGTLSREVGTLASGENVTDGAVLALSGGKLVASEGDSGAETIVGIVLGDHDATDGDKKGVPYIARLAEVKADLIHVDDSDGEPSAGVLEELAGLFIIAR